MALSSHTAELVAAGLDGCRAGWVAAIGLASGETALARFDDIASALAWAEAAPRPVPMTVDMPIGLPRHHGLRACDRAARARLGRRWMTVFAPPDRELFGLDFVAARALVLRRRVAQPGVPMPIATHQTINITPKVAEVDTALRGRPDRAGRLAECHPELSFAELAGRELAPKRSATGREQRRALVTGGFADAVQRLEAVTWSRRQVAADDLLDAYAALWSALRFARGTHIELGDGVPDDVGLPQRIVI